MRGAVVLPSGDSATWGLGFRVEGFGDRYRAKRERRFFFDVHLEAEKVRLPQGELTFAKAKIWP